jgi:3-oxoacyl-[acyl-carrier protein] reductase
VAEKIAAKLQEESTRRTPSRIIYISPWSWDQFVDPIHYETAKSGIIALTKFLANKLACRGINVNCIVPGFIKTTLPSSLEKQHGDEVKSKIPIGYMGETDDVIETVLFLIGASAKYITGQVISVSGGLN